MNFPKISEEVFVILQSHNYECTLYDDESKQVFEPEEARRFASKKKNLLVAIVDDGDNSKIKLYFRKDIPAESLIGLMDTLRMTATKYNMTFSSREQDHDITPKDFSTKMSVSENRSNLTEGMYGTSRSSYLRLENARMIVRHASKINEELMGARGRNIDSIYIENKNGERMLFPTKQLAPARAMTHHVSNGGIWTDEGGQDIINLAHEYSDLREMAGHIRRNSGTLTEDAQVVREKCREGMKALRRTFEGICRKTKYEDVMQSIRKPLNEDDDLSEAVTKLKQNVGVDGTEIEPRVYETTARCLREIEASDNKGMIGVAGLSVPAQAWNDFKKGELALGEHLHRPAESDDPKAYYGSALRAIGHACKDPHMGALFDKMADEWTDNPSRACMAFTDKAIGLVGWEPAKKRDPMDSTQEFSEWINDHRAETLDEEVPVEADQDAEELDEGEPEDEAQLDEDDINDPTGYKARKAERAKRFSASQGKKLKTCPACSGSGHYDTHGSPKCGNCNGTGKVRESLDEEDTYITQGLEPEEGDLTLDDIIIPTNQGASLKDEVTVNTVVDPDSGEEEIPDQSYIDRLRALSGIRR